MADLPGGPPWLARATLLRGLYERPGDEDNPVILHMAKVCGGKIAATYIHDSIAWCALFINYCLIAEGRKGDDSLWALDFANYGQKLTGPAVGAIASMRRTGGGHVFFVRGRDSSSNLVGLGGNQSDMVSEEPFDASAVVAYTWPVDYPLPASVGQSYTDLSALPLVTEAPAIRIPDIVLPGVGPVQPLPPSPTVERVTGRVSWFGGPDDHGSGDPEEGLALIDSVSQNPAIFGPDAGTGLFRRLNPAAMYCSTRWSYPAFGSNVGAAKKWLREHKARVTAGGLTIEAWPADWGPNISTGRSIDLSPGLMAALGLNTDDVATLEIDRPGAPSPAPGPVPGPPGPAPTPTPPHSNPDSHIQHGRRTNSQMSAKLRLNPKAGVPARASPQ